MSRKKVRNFIYIVHDSTSRQSDNVIISVPSWMDENPRPKGGKFFYNSVIKKSLLYSVIFSGS
jgi:hypothetical protein